NAAASIARAPSRTISSSNDPPAALFSLDASASWTTLSMGVPSRTSASTPALDQTYLDFRSSSGRCAPSRHQAEGHPQVLIIAPGRQVNLGTGQMRPNV